MSRPNHAVYVNTAAGWLPAAPHYRQDLAPHTDVCAGLDGAVYRIVWASDLTYSITRNDRPYKEGVPTMAEAVALIAGGEV